MSRNLFSFATSISSIYKNLGINCWHSFCLAQRFMYLCLANDSVLLVLFVLQSKLDLKPSYPEYFGGKGQPLGFKCLQNNSSVFIYLYGKLFMERYQFLADEE